MGVGDFRSGPYLLVAGLRVAVANVVFDAAEKQRRRLRHPGKAAAQIPRIKALDRDPLNEHLPLLRVVETQQQVEQRRLACPRRPHQRQGFARLDAQAQTIHRIALGS